MAHADSAPRLDEFPIGRELADAGGRSALDALSHRVGRRHALSFVSVGDVDAAVGTNDDVVRLVELAVRAPRLARDAKAEQLLALRAELVHLMALGAFLVAREIGNPYVALAVQRDAVRRHHD